MSATRTPKLDAIRAWIALADPGAPFEYVDRWPDPPEWDDPAVRADVVVAMCASGAPAELPHPFVIIDGKTVPAPPKYVRRRATPTPPANEERTA